MADFAAHRTKMREKIAAHLGESLELPDIGKSLTVPVSQVPVYGEHDQILYTTWVAKIPAADIDGLQMGGRVVYAGETYSVSQIPPAKRGQVELEFY